MDGQGQGAGDNGDGDSDNDGGMGDGLDGTGGGYSNLLPDKKIKKSSGAPGANGKGGLGSKLDAD